jgi:hypothetical protein
MRLLAFRHARQGGGLRMRARSADLGGFPCASRQIGKLQKRPGRGSKFSHDSSNGRSSDGEWKAALFRERAGCKPRVRGMSKSMEANYGPKPMNLRTLMPDDLRVASDDNAIWDNANPYRTWLRSIPAKPTQDRYASVDSCLVTIKGDRRSDGPHLPSTHSTRLRANEQCGSMPIAAKFIMRSRGDGRPSLFIDSAQFQLLFRCPTIILAACV